MTLHTTLADGLKHDQIVVQRDDLEIGGIGIKQLKVAYSPTDDLWEGGASIVLPTPNRLGIAADLQIQHGSFHKFSGSVDGLNVPIIGAIYLQRIAVVSALTRRRSAAASASPSAHRWTAARSYASTATSSTRRRSARRPGISTSTAP